MRQKNKQEASTVQKVTASPTHIKDLVADPQNRRQHNPRNIGMVVDALQAVGAARSIVIDENNVVLAGNGVLEAAGEAGLTRLRVVEADGQEIIAVRRTGLSEAQKRHLAIADNRSAELAQWNAAQFKDDLGAGLDFKGFFTQDELQAILGKEPAGGLTDPDEVPPERPTGIVAGDLFELGRHRLLCGDSTQAGDVARLMGNSRAAMVFADPPYGYNYQSNMRTKTAKFAVLENDDRILDGFLTPLPDISDGWVLVCTSWKVIVQWVQACAVLGEMSNMIVWDKGGGGMGDLKGTFSTDFELILAYGRGRDICGKRIGSVWSIGKDASESYEHATQKPVALPVQALQSLTAVNAIVYDPFGGSGTVTIAAEQTGRACYAIELNPSYVQVAIDRWEAFTGQKAQKVGEAVHA